MIDVSFDPDGLSENQKVANQSMVDNLSRIEIMYWIESLRATEHYDIAEDLEDRMEEKYGR